MRTKKKARLILFEGTSSSQHEWKKNCIHFIFSFPTSFEFSDLIDGKDTLFPFYFPRTRVAEKKSNRLSSNSFSFLDLLFGSNRFRQNFFFLSFSSQQPLSSSWRSPSFSARMISVPNNTPKPFSASAVSAGSSPSKRQHHSVRGPIPKFPIHKIEDSPILNNDISYNLPSSATGATVGGCQPSPMPQLQQEREQFYKQQSKDILLKKLSDKVR